MKFDEFKKLREKAIEINGLDESVDLNEYKDSIHEASEAVNEMEDIGDFFFGHLKAMKSLAILIARYPMIAKRKNNIAIKAYEKVKSIEHKANDKREAYRDSLEQKWRDKINKLPLEKRDIAREAMKNDVNGKIDLFNQKVNAEVKKINIKSRNAENSVNDKWDRIQGRNELPRKIWNNRWNASKARIDGNAEVDLIESKIEIDERYSDKESGSMDQQIERLRKKAQKEKAESEVKAKEAEARAKAEEAEQFDNLDDDTKEIFQELQPILNDFINASAKYVSVAGDITNSLSEFDNEKDDFNKLSDEDKESNKEDHKETINKLKEEISKSKEELAEAKKEANEAKNKLKDKKESASKAGMWDSIQKQIADFNKSQDDYKRDSSGSELNLDEPEENSGESEDGTKEEKVTRAKEELNKHQTDVLDKYKDDLDIATSADEPDKNKIAELETQVLQAEIQKSKLQYTLTKLEDEEGVNDKLKEISDKINDLTDELQAKKSKGGEDEEGGSDNQKKKETDQKREELKNKIESGESKVAELKDKDPDKAAKIQKNIDNLKDKLEALDKDPNESANFGILDKLHEAMDLILLELNNSLQAKTKFAEFLEMKKNK